MAVRVFFTSLGGHSVKKTIYKITVLGWAKYNGTLKRGHKCILLSTRFLDDSKIRALSPVAKLLYLSCLLVAGESIRSQDEVTSKSGHSQIEVSHESLVFHSGVKSQSIQSQLDLLQSLQLVTYEKTQALLDRIGKDRIGKDRNKISAEVNKPDKYKPEKKQLILSAHVSRAADRGCIDEFIFDDVCRGRLESVTHRAQKSWLLAYPSVDFITQEVRRANGWIETNPQKAPKDFGKFMLNWLSRAYETYRKGLPSNRSKVDTNDETRRKIMNGEV